MKIRRNAARRGTFIPMLAVSISALFGFVALAVDLGLLTVARTECQNAADTAALSGCRQLNNKVDAFGVTVADNNRVVSESTANATAKNNTFINTAFQDAQISVTTKIYYYNTTSNTFQKSTAQTVSGTTYPWSASEVTLTVSQPTFFAKVFGLTSMPNGATAVAIHRPRDVAVVLDLTGSMAFGSTFNWPADSTSDNVRGILSPDPAHPQYGHYQRYRSYQTTIPMNGAISNTSGSGATPSVRPNPLLINQAFIKSSGEVNAVQNYTVETPSGPPIVKDYLTSTLADGTITPTSAQIRNAFHHWDPAGSGDPTVSGASPPFVTSPVLNYANYYSSYNGTTVVTPAPISFKDQRDTDDAGVSLPYLGDKHPRKWGATVAEPAGATPLAYWDPTDANGAAITAAEYLGWSAKYASGSTLPNTVPNRATLSLSPSATYLADWSDFRDATWERNGYDLDVKTYVAARNAYGNWDPRWDYSFTSSNWVHSMPIGVTAPPAAVKTNINNIVKVNAGTFKGYSMGPGYWGKTPFIWPPDPRWGGGTGSPDPTSPSVSNPVQDTSGNWICDWRRRFFTYYNGATTQNYDPQGDNVAGGNPNDGIDESLLRNGVGSVLTDGGTSSATAGWRINYPAVLKWLKTGPQVLPANLRAGRILYYTSIPDTVPNTGGTLNELFWRDYINYVFGYRAGGRDYQSSKILAGDEIYGWPEGVTPAIATSTMAQYNGLSVNDARPCMNYMDNPNRPRLHLWFGPMSMMDFIECKQPNRSWTAGTVHQAQCWQLKAGIQSALDDIRNNHPNDWVGLAYFAASFNDRRVPMGTNWTRMKNTLFFPYNKIDATTGIVSGEFIPYNTSFNTVSRTNIPNADSGTDPATGLMNGYNLLSSSTTLGGTGRRGAAKIVIFETDGVPNCLTNGALQNDGPNSRYTGISASSFTFNGDPTVIANALLVVDAIVADTNNTAGQPSGFSLPNSKARVYPIAFGDLFSTNTTAKTGAVTFLTNMAIRGNTLDAGGTLPSGSIITGTYQNRIDTLRSCLERIMQSGVQVTLIE